MDGKKCVISMFVKEAMGTGHTLGDARFWRRVLSSAAVLLLSRWSLLLLIVVPYVPFLLVVDPLLSRLL